MPPDHHGATEVAKYTGDLLSFTVVVGTLAQWLPSVAALFTIVWTAIRIWETRTVQSWLGKPGGDE